MTKWDLFQEDILENLLIIDLVDQEWKTMHLIDSEMTLDKVQLS